MYLNPSTMHPNQRVNHIHLEDDEVRLHWHPPEREEDSGIRLPMEAFKKALDLMYWKKGEELEGGGDVSKLDVKVGVITFEHPGGREVVSTDSLWSVVAALQARKDAERRRAMGSHNSRGTSKWVEQLRG